MIEPAYLGERYYQAINLARYTGLSFYGTRARIEQGSDTFALSKEELQLSIEQHSKLAEDWQEYNEQLVTVHRHYVSVLQEGLHALEGEKQS